MSTQPPPNHKSLGTILKSDLPASFVVFLVALPLCMGIAIASGAPVYTGLLTGIIGGLVVGVLAGAPLQVSGPAAGLTVLVYALIQEQGLERLGIVVLLAGVFQVVAGVFKLGRWFRAVSPAVIKGMLAGIGVLILSSQFHVMVDDEPKESGLRNLLTIPEAIYKGLPWPESSSKEQSAEHAELLRALGNLHADQVALEEHVDEHIPRIFTPGEEFELTWIEDAATKQKRIRLRMEQLHKRLEANAFFEDPDNQKRERQEKAAAALKAINEATDELQAALTTVNEASERLPAEDLQTLRDAQRTAAENLAAQVRSMKNHDWAAKVGLLTILIIVGWKLFLPKIGKAIPPSLVAVIAATALAVVLTLPVMYVEVPRNLLAEIHFPTWTTLMHSDWGALIKWGLIIAAIASAETLLCATAVDQMSTDHRTKYDRELWAQGVGNVCCGLVGALPMTGVIVRSTANIESGGKTRLSAILHGFWLLLFVVFLANLLSYIPRSALAAILVYTGYKLIDVKSIKVLWKVNKSEAGIYFATVIGIVVFDLLTGVLIGIALSAVKLLYIFSHLQVEVVEEPEEGKTTLYISGSATFVRLPKLAEKLEAIPDDTELHVDFEHLDYIDHACLELLMQWGQRREANGGKLVIDWEWFHGTFRGDPKSQRERGDAMTRKIAEKRNGNNKKREAEEEQKSA